MISNLAKVRIEKKAQSISSRNPFFLLAEKGKLEEKQIRNYLNNLVYVFKNTTLCLTKAEKRSSELGHEELAKFFRHKTQEEAGHDEWAKDDLRSLGAPMPNLNDKNICPAILKLMSYLDEIIEQDPRLYLFYMLFAEYLTVLVAPKLLGDLDQNCGIGRNQMSAIAKHEELDKDHVLEDLNVIDRFVGPALDPEYFLSIIEDSAEHVDNFLTEMAKAPLQ